MAVQVIKMVDSPELRLGVVEVGGGMVAQASTSFQEECARLAEDIIPETWEIPEDKRSAVRKVLKLGGFSPTGRNRPAQELLVRDIKERGGFNHINNVVDVNNLVSLELLVPISIFDVAKLEPGPVTIRIGEPGEGYVFNQSGHALDVKRCLVCCHGDPPGTPIGTPVKDSMATKIFEGATGFLGVIYFPAAQFTEAELETGTQRFAEVLSRETGGRIVNCEVV
jgi:DNA/RNA-binding domain of Phe-tRNA-synthetase-like protein